MTHYLTAVNRWTSFVAGAAAAPPSKDYLSELLTQAFHRGNAATWLMRTDTARLQKRAIKLNGLYPRQRLLWFQGISMTVESGLRCLAIAFFAAALLALVGVSCAKKTPAIARFQMLKADLQKSRAAKDWRSTLASAMAMRSLLNYSPPSRFWKSHVPKWASAP